MKPKAQKITRTDKILVILYELSGGTTKSLRFEDIVVALFSKYPHDFALQGYSQYPDSEGVGKEFYRGKNLKNLGLITYSNKIFSLTDRGITYTEKIINSIDPSIPTENQEKLSRFAEKELKRIVATEGFGLYTQKKTEKITDSDFFNYLGITPRTDRGDFQGRLSVIEDVMKELKKSDNQTSLYKQVLSYHDFLIRDKFQNIIKYYGSNK